ncbi:proton-coupled folate transporter-like [Antedon mediterranea]|uniref:proton-coupled folate transporter-like n=1 Tax=Antedon mediterranea TaxID=105859 RepID=UPI003AF80D23
MSSLGLLKKISGLTEISVLVIYLAFALLSIQGVVFTEYILQLQLNSSNRDVEVSSAQILLANWTTIFLICQSLPAVFVILYISTWSDCIGRKITMILPTVGMLVTSISFTIVLVYRLPIEYLLIGNLSIGLTGNTILLRSGVGSYLSDISNTANFTFRMSVLLGVNFLGIALGQLVFSVWIDNNGFIEPFIFITVLLVFSIFYIVFMIEESIDTTVLTKKYSFKNVVADMINVILNNTNNRRKIMLLWMFVRILNSSMVNALFHGLQLYAIGPPLNMSTSGAGYFTSSYFLSNTVGMLCITKLLQKLFKTNDYTLFYIGSISAMASSIVIAVTSDTLVYLSIPLAVLAVLPKAIVEARLSKLVEQNEQGAVFAQAGALDNIGFLLGPIWVGVTYAASVESQPSLIFYIMFIGSLLNMLVVIFIQWNFGKTEETTESSNSEFNENIPLLMET